MRESRIPTAVTPSPELRVGTGPSQPPSLQDPQPYLLQGSDPSGHESCLLTSVCPVSSRLWRGVPGALRAPQPFSWELLGGACPRLGEVYICTCGLGQIFLAAACHQPTQGPAAQGGWPSEARPTASARAAGGGSVCWPVSHWLLPGSSIGLFLELGPSPAAARIPAEISSHSN